jgi:hypothetical protein
MKVSALLVAAATVLANANAEDAHVERNLAKVPNPRLLPNTLFPMPQEDRRLEGMTVRMPESVLKAKKKMEGVLDPTTIAPTEEKRRLEAMTVRMPESVLKAKKKMEGVFDPTTIAPTEEKRRLRTDSA